MKTITFRQLQRLPARKLASMAENSLTVKVNGKPRYILELIGESQPAQEVTIVDKIGEEAIEWLKRMKSKEQEKSMKLIGIT